MYSVYSFRRSKEWELFIRYLRLERIAQDGELYCEHCGKPIVKKYDCIGHHVIELTEENVNDFSISLNPDNVKLVHFRCHNKIHKRFGYNTTAARRVWIVYGSPCSGKTSFVLKSAGKNDLILDIDRIWQAVTINELYNKPDSLKRNVLAIRDCIMDQIKTRAGEWQNAWIIGGYPMQTERKRIADMVGGELIHIDTEKEVCMVRAKERGGDWPEYVCDWWDSFTE